MDFIGFVILLVISIVVSGVLHFGLRYYVSGGMWSFVSKVVVGWIGASLGTPVFGQWFPGLFYQGGFQDIYIVPAILGSAALLIVAVDVVKMLGGK